MIEKKLDATCNSFGIIFSKDKASLKKYQEIHQYQFKLVRAHNNMYTALLA